MIKRKKEKSIEACKCTLIQGTISISRKYMVTKIEPKDEPFHKRFEVPCKEAFH